MKGAEIAAAIVALIMICGPMAAGAKKGMDEGVTRDTPVVATPTAPSAAPMAPTNAPK